MVERLRVGSATVSELGTGLGITQQAISKHLGVLVRAGLVVQSPEGRSRRCVFDPTPMQRAEQWIAESRALWRSRLQQLDEHLSPRDS